MLLKELNKKKSFEDYKKYRRNTAIIEFLIGTLLMISYFTIKTLSDFASGMLIGVIVVCYIASIYYFGLIRNLKKLRQEYVSVYDERQNLILSKTSRATLLFLEMLIISFLLLYAFMNVTISYLNLLMILLYSILLSSFVFKFIFSKIV